MSELQDYYDSFRQQVASGALCTGPTCPGWFLSDVDTWHACSCGRGTPENHPEREPEEVK